MVTERTITPVEPDVERDSEETTSLPFPAVVERSVSVVRTPLNWLWGHGFRFLFAMDAVGLYVTLVAINLVRFGWNWPTYPHSYYFVGFGIATAIALAVNYFSGLYEREPRLGYRAWLPRVTLATAIAVGLDSMATLATGRYLMPRLNLAVFFVLCSIGLTLNRSLSRRLAKRRRGPSRVVLVGDESEVVRVADQFNADPEADVVATTRKSSELFDVVKANRATDVLLLDIEAFDGAFPEPMTALDREQVGIHQRVSASETLLGLKSIREIAGMPFTRIRTTAMAPHQLHLKRLFDLTIVIVCAPIWLAILALLGLYVRIVAGSPVLYRQRRVGLHGSHFTVVKLRTMRTDAEAGGAQLATQDDPRVVRGLGWLRSTRADELPQLWNVLKGQMSLVGPRPERPELIQTIERDVAGYARRHELPPGLTGFAQVQGRYDTHADFKLGYDLQYLVNWSIILDVQILMRTVWVVLTRRV